jgi:hypothetical protein
MAHKGKFRPKFPEKYKGDPTNIVYRSGWEFKFFKNIDANPDIIWWQSEEIIVPYRSPIDNKMHRYFPDVVLHTKDGRTLMIEIKPAVQTKPPIKKEAHPRRFITEAKTYAVNIKKWEAATEFCKDRKWEFKIFTEKELGV